MGSLKLVSIVSFPFFLASSLNAQNINIGFQDSIFSEVLEENRRIFIHLPDDYENSDKSYPVIYRLDGEIDLLVETVGVIYRLAYREELLPDMIVVMIRNTHRDRDMLPVTTFFYQSEPGAVNFQKFINSELVPYIDNIYRTTNERILCGQSLSSIFTLYNLLTETSIFNSYIACSAGFPDCEDYFMNLAKEMKSTHSDREITVFLSNGLKDPLDPDGKMNQMIGDFSNLIQSKDNITSKYVIYEEEGHVPYQSLYHGLKFLYGIQSE
jgi:predicted alpha/beta superfamily hydrolase